MENIAEKLNLVIDYLESHLTEEINQAKIAQIACCSYYDVGRIFSLIADISISDYIRRRRLTLAGSELKYSGAKVIDVALKYGYDSPVSFARAFQSFHGFNPSLATKDDAALNVFPRLIYQICVKEVHEAMKKDVITKQAILERAICLLGRPSSVNGNIGDLKMRMMISRICQRTLMFCRIIIFRRSISK